MQKHGLRLVYKEDAQQIWQIQFTVRLHFMIIGTSLKSYFRPLKSFSNQPFSIYKCSPSRLILSHQSTAPSLSIQLLIYFSKWKGLALCALFSFHEHLVISESWLRLTHHISGHLDSKKGSLESSLVYCITKGNFTWLDMEGYIWLLQHTLWIILRFFMFQCRHIEVSAVSDFPGLMVQKCG